MRVVFFGSGEFGVPSLRWVANSPHELPAVVTPPDRPAGRGKKLMPPPVARQAQADNLPLFRSEDVNQPDFVRRMAHLDADLGIVVDFGQKLREPVRSAFRHGCVNTHGSLLPRYRGAAPVAWAILEGEQSTGVTVFRLVDRMDAGPVLVRRETRIDPVETCEELEGRLARIGCDAIDAALRRLEADPDDPGEPQDESLVTLAPKLTKAHGHVNFEDPAERIHRQCRAMWPWPGARCRYVSASGRNEEITIATASTTLAPAPYPPGCITEIMTVCTGDGTLEIHSLKPAGKRLMSWRDFVNGRQVQPMDRLESLGTPPDTAP
jgi:methionyl-tRNA formyltransferase